MDYLTFFGTAAAILGDFQSLSALVLEQGVPLYSYCQQEALKLLCRYVFPTCDPAFREPTSQAICRKACFTLEDFLCKDFYIVLKLVIQANLIDTSVIDPPLCGPLDDTEAGNVPDCISTLDGGGWSLSPLTRTCSLEGCCGWSHVYCVCVCVYCISMHVHVCVWYLLIL